MTALALMVSALAPPDDAPPALTAEIVSVNGTGCPGTTAGVGVTADRKAFTLTYTNFAARAGTGATPTEFRRNCQVNLRFKYSDEFTFAIKGFEHQGSAKLQAGASGVLRANDYYAGGAQRPVASHTFSGPFNDNWRTKDEIAGDALFYPPCGQKWNLNVNTEIRVNKGSSTELSTMTEAGSEYRLHWKKCG
ncbi:DUF4360 domain-containing protein [Lentzea sp. NBRC 105346]|uniref:DUF4360 domain-containing protein n=1 Tax=Lentzea sp. NBRC 105346 TaxID=3032205 RepID=UPI002555B8A8|nr:DUF4360 domain-containing protein [Lentzea sp. NBRC 105346]